MSLSWNCEAGTAATKCPVTGDSGWSGPRGTGLTLQSSAPPAPLRLRNTMSSMVDTVVVGACARRPDGGINAATTDSVNDANSVRRRGSPVAFMERQYTGCVMG